LLLLKIVMLKYATHLITYFSHFSLHIDHLSRVGHDTTYFPASNSCCECPLSFEFSQESRLDKPPQMVAAPDLLNHDHTMIKVLLVQVILFAFNRIMHCFHDVLELADELTLDFVVPERQHSPELPHIPKVPLLLLKM